MAQNSARNAGRHFLQIPGPSPLPDRVMRAMDMPIIDHRGPDFAKLAKRCLDGIKSIFKTTNPVVIYTATGTGAWEAALVNTLNAGDRVLMQVGMSLRRSPCRMMFTSWSTADRMRPAPWCCGDA